MNPPLEVVLSTDLSTDLATHPAAVWMFPASPWPVLGDLWAHLQLGKPSFWDGFYRRCVSEWPH